MAEHLFITGPKRWGKSTLLSFWFRPFSGHIGGFFVQRLLINGTTVAFRLADLTEEEYVPNLEVDSVDDFTHIIGRIQPDSAQMLWYPEVFDQQGVKILQAALIGNYEVILMDELGRIELQAPEFMRRVFTVLDGDTPVIGVIKAETNSFLHKIRTRKDVTVLDLDYFNTIN